MRSMVFHCVNCALTYTLNGSFGSDVNVILNVTFATVGVSSVESLLNGKIQINPYQIYSETT